jgi:NADPH:quinone reductase-like Zn-dependent oxidoreductase
VLIATSRSATTPLELVSVPSRRLGASEVRVAVRAIGVNPVDWKMREGGPLRFAQRILGPRGPLVVGVDFAGEVVERGDRVTDLAVGARIVGGTDFSRQQRGSYADEVVVRPDQCAVLPDAIGFDAAACLPVAAVTPWIVLTERLPIGPGSKVLVLGASGGAGLYAVSLARKLGAAVFGVCSTRNVELVEGHGARAIDYALGDALAAAHEYGPFDLILHMVGTATYPLRACRALLRPGGIVDLAVLRASDLLAIAFARQVKAVLGRPTRARLTPLVDALAKGELETVIEQRFPLAEAERAHQLSRAGKVVGKLLLIP